MAVYVKNESYILYFFVAMQVAEICLSIFIDNKY